MSFDGATGTRRWLVLVALALSVLVVGLDMTVLNVALPTIGPALHASTTDLQWFVDAYSLVVAAALLPAGLLGDRYGRKTVLIGGVALFGAMSAACAYAPDAAALIATRAVLGLAAAAITPLALSALPVLFTAAERPRAIAILMTSTMLGLPLGPVLGGWLLTRFWWGSVFLINVPVTVLALVAVALLMPQSRNPGAARFDTVGALLSSAGLVGVTYGVVQAGSDGWSSAGSVTALTAGAALLAAFVVQERRAAARPGSEPLVDLALFRSRAFSWGTALATLVSFALFGLMFAMPLYFQEVQGADSLGAGLRLLPLIGGLIAGGAVAERLRTPRAPRGGGPAVAPVGVRPVVAAGFAVMAAGLAAGAATRAGTGEGYSAAWFALVGVGVGFAMPASTDAALGALSKERSGMGSAAIMAMRQVGATIGVAVLGTILGSVYRSRLDASAAVPAAARAAAGQSVTAGAAAARELGLDPMLDAVRGSFVHAMDGMLIVCAAIAGAATVLAVLFLPGRAAAPSSAGSGTAGPHTVEPELVETEPVDKTGPAETGPVETGSVESAGLGTRSTRPGPADGRPGRDEGDREDEGLAAGRGAAGPGASGRRR